MKTRRSERCPACGSGMFPGDVVCRACERRVNAAKPGLMASFTNRDLLDVARGFFLRGQIVGHALQLAPKRGRPAKAGTANTEGAAS